MISELICLEVIKILFGKTTTYGQVSNPDDHGDSTSGKSEEQHALPDRDLVRPLLTKYDLTDIDTAIRWLALGGYIGKSGWGIHGLWVHVLTQKGIEVAKEGHFPDSERKLFYLEEPHQVFLARQFRPKDSALVASLQSGLSQAGYEVVDGKVDGLEEFRHAILTKLKKARFFLCLLTHRCKLETGSYVSSVWLYQEIGAAIAMGKSPLLLVEDGLDPHYAGELQKTYEYVPFSRPSFDGVLAEITRRFDVDLERNAIPLPKRTLSHEAG